MTAVRPEGGVPGQPGDPDDWSVYVQPAEQTLQLRLPAAEAPVRQEPSDDGRAAGRRQAPGPVGLKPGTGRRRASGKAAGPRPPRPKERKRVLAARLVGELFITLGVVMLLFVSYQLWWTNVLADRSAQSAGSKLEQQWAQQPPTGPTGGGASAAPQTKFEPGQGFAIIHIPKLGLTYPIAEGTNKQQVLDKGLVGHYTGTAMPSDATGNFAVAAHRTTHGQPFRKIGQLVPGDKVVVETATAFYTYEVAGGIPETPPTNVTVLQGVPKGSPFTAAGRYLTMTTCTPEFSARGRLIVFGKMVEERPRSQGQPEALTGQH
ncbi:class E sortase [Streptomyces sp. TLI_171]|uniref:class E sortase n=1 Tax=Streptomyces sp. TLI_171 TaxID=1938859 RepID=UPI000C18D667|nr:class E sortase [Streptomyces sp. TLI_171]RKE20324.1 sortase A [Streptomyces sp. TLI_171]